MGDYNTVDATIERLYNAVFVDLETSPYVAESEAAHQNVLALPHRLKISRTTDVSDPGLIFHLRTFSSKPLPSKGPRVLFSSFRSP